MSVRPATEDDLDAVVALWGQLAASHHAQDPRFHPASSEGLARYRLWMQEALADSDRLLLVVDGEHSVAAFLHAQVQRVALSLGARPSGYISDICVAPAQRRRGLGRSLVEEALVVFRHRGLERVGLNVAEHNADAEAFWQAMGFAPYTRKLLRILD